jgi:hypothetical protein
MHNFIEVSGHNLESSQTYATFTLQTSFKPLLLGGGGGGGFNPLVEVTVNSKEENSKDFCPNYVKEFDL